MSVFSAGSWNDAANNELLVAASQADEGGGRSTALAKRK